MLVLFPKMSVMLRQLTTGGSVAQYFGKYQQWGDWSPPLMHFHSKIFVTKANQGSVWVICSTSPWLHAAMARKLPSCQLVLSSLLMEFQCPSLGPVARWLQWLQLALLSNDHARGKNRDWQPPPIRCVPLAITSEKWRKNCLDGSQWPAIKVIFLKFPPHLH